MKKTKLMRAALLLLVLTLITSCFVGGTFAKYTTSANGTDTARVAKWGFQPTTIDLSNLFTTTYNNVNGADDVIAPGTTNSAEFSFTYGGNASVTAPEVAYTFTVSTEGSTCAPSIINNKNIKWSLDGVPAQATTAADAGSWDALLAAIEKLSGDTTGKKTYAPGNLPDAFNATGDNKHTVSWVWDFYTTGDADDEDTKMGNATDLATVKLVITVSATQVD